MISSASNRVSDATSGIRTMHQMEQEIHELYFKLNGSTHFAKLTQCIMCLKFYTDFKLMISEVTTWFADGVQHKFISRLSVLLRSYCGPY